MDRRGEHGWRPSYTDTPPGGGPGSAKGTPPSGARRRYAFPPFLCHSSSTSLAPFGPIADDDRGIEEFSCLVVRYEPRFVPEVGRPGSDRPKRFDDFFRQGAIQGRSLQNCFEKFIVVRLLAVGEFVVDSGKLCVRGSLEDHALQRTFDAVTGQ